MVHRDLKLENVLLDENCNIKVSLAFDLLNPQDCHTPPGPVMIIILSSYRTIYGHELNQFADLNIACCVYMRMSPTF